MLANASIQNTRRYKACRFAPLSTASRLRRRFAVSHGWIPAFAGMTRVGLEEMQQLFRGVA
jgi:hypothetical protein